MSPGLLDKLHEYWLVKFACFGGGAGAVKYCPAQRLEPADLWLAGISAVIVAVVLLPGLDTLPYYFEEPRRVLIARHMIESGSFLVPMLDGHIYLAKPPLYNWLLIPMFDENVRLEPASARLVSVVSLALLAAWLVVLTRRWLGDRMRLALAVGLIAAPEITAKATLAEIDLFFAVLVTVSIWSWFARWFDGRAGFGLWLVPLVFMAAGIMTKGPQAPLFFYVSVIAWLIFQKQWRSLFTVAHGISLVLALAGPALWLWVVIDALGGIGPVLDNFSQEVTRRGVGLSLAEHLKHALGYPVKVTLGAILLSLFGILFAFRRCRAVMDRDVTVVAAFAALALITNLVPYLLRDSAVRYFLPMMPTMAILGAVMVEALTRRTSAPSRGLRIVIGTGYVASLVVLGYLATLHVRRFMGESETLALTDSVGIGLILLLTAGALMLWRRHATDARNAVIAVLVVLAVASRVLVTDRLGPVRAGKLDKAGRPNDVVAMLENQLESTGSPGPVVYLGKLPFAIPLAAGANRLVPVAGNGFTRDDILLLYVRRDVPGPVPPSGARQIAAMPYRYEGKDGRMLFFRFAP